MKQVFINYQLTKEEFTHEYNIIDEDNISYLFRSNESDWSEEAKGGLSCNVEDNGDEIVVHFEGQKKVKLDYNQAQELFILLLNTQDSNLEFRESKTTLRWPL